MKTPFTRRAGRRLTCNKEALFQTRRKHGSDVWQFRWSEKDRNGRRIYRKRVIGTVQQYADA